MRIQHELLRCALVEVVVPARRILQWQYFDIYRLRDIYLVMPGGELSIHDDELSFKGHKTPTVLLLFKCELQEERSRLTRAIDSTHTKIRTLAHSGRAMSQMSPQSTRPSEHHSFQNVAEPRAGEGKSGGKSWIPPDYLFSDPYPRVRGLCRETTICASIWKGREFLSR
jgi:hypothetical protein